MHGSRRKQLLGLTVAWPIAARSHFIRNTCDMKMARFRAGPFLFPWLFQPLPFLREG